MTVLKRTYLCNSAVKSPAEFKKTVECILAEKEEKRLKCIPAKKRWNKSNRTGPNGFKINNGAMSKI